MAIIGDAVSNLSDIGGEALALIYRRRLKRTIKVILCRRLSLMLAIKHAAMTWRAQSAIGCITSRPVVVILTASNGNPAIQV